MRDGEKDPEKREISIRDPNKGLILVLIGNVLCDYWLSILNGAEELQP